MGGIAVERTTDGVEVSELRLLCADASHAGWGHDEAPFLVGHEFRVVGLDLGEDTGQKGLIGVPVGRRSCGTLGSNVIITTSGGRQIGLANVCFRLLLLTTKFEIT